MKNANLEIRAVIFEKDGLTYVQCIDADMLSYGKTEEAAISSFAGMLSVYLHIRNQEGKRPFAGSNSVPEEFRKQFDDPRAEKREIILSLHAVQEVDMSINLDQEVHAVLKRKAA